MPANTPTELRKHTKMAIWRRAGAEEERNKKGSERLMGARCFFKI